MAARHPIDDELVVAEAAVRHAQMVRRFHARKSPRGSAQRQADLQEARERLRTAMKPLRSYLGRAAYKNATNYNADLHDRVRETSAAMQKERRKLHKMAARSTNARPR
jgi:hypothetical protein